jgi:hypothetical protein
MFVERRRLCIQKVLKIRNMGDCEPDPFLEMIRKGFSECVNVKHAHCSLGKTQMPAHSIT